MEFQLLDQLTKIINDALNGTAKFRKSVKLSSSLLQFFPKHDET